MSRIAALLRRLFGGGPARPQNAADREEERKHIIEAMLNGHSCCG